MNIIHKNAAVTLVELIVVMTIISILAIIGVTSYSYYLEHARRDDGVAALRANQILIEEYIYENGGAPAEGVVTLLTPSEQGYYDITYTWQDLDKYILTATVVTGSAQDDQITGCAHMYLYSWSPEVYGCDN